MIAPEKATAIPPPRIMLVIVEARVSADERVQVFL